MSDAGLSGGTVKNRSLMESTLDNIEIMGLVAGLLNTFAFLPQAVKTWRTRSADDFSLPTLLLLIVAIGLWTIYGVLRAAPAIWLANGVTWALIASILAVKLLPRSTGAT